MAESRIKPENYITIQGWMVTELGLKNNRLLLYAIIYGFSQDGKSGYSGRQDYLMEWLDCSRSALNNYIKELKGKGVFREVTDATGKRTLRAVRVNQCPNNGHNVQKMDMGCANSGHGNVQKMDMGCANSGHLPINNNIDNTLYINSSSVDIDTPVEQAPTPPTVEEIADYCRERGNGIDPQRFHDFYSLRKWQGREGSIAAPEQWQAIIRLWETNGRDGKKKERQTEYHGGSFDTDETFNKALRLSYGDEIADVLINGG